MSFCLWWIDIYVHRSIYIYIYFVLKTFNETSSTLLWINNWRETSLDLVFHTKLSYIWSLSEINFYLILYKQMGSPQVVAFYITISCVAFVISKIIISILLYKRWKRKQMVHEDGLSGTYSWKPWKTSFINFWFFD